MANDSKDNSQETPQAPTVGPKPSWLREVEEDAVYITKKRFAEAEEEKKREAEKQQREADRAAKK